ANRSCLKQVSMREKVAIDCSMPAVNVRRDGSWSSMLARMIPSRKGDAHEPSSTARPAVQAPAVPLGRRPGRVRGACGDHPNYFDKRFLEWDGDPNQVPTRDKRFIY